jgi:WG containing repeat
LKRILFIFTVLILYTQVAYTQNFRLETVGKNRLKTFLYFKGSDSLQYVISEKNDTLQIKNWYRNGKPLHIRWQLDSSYSFDILGQVTEKEYKLYKESSYLGSKISVAYNKNGTIKRKYENENENTYYEKYDENGSLSYTIHTQDLPKISLTKVKDKLGRLRNSVRVDTLKFINRNEGIVSIIDTIFYPNGNVYRIRLTDKNEVVSNKYFDKNGVFLKDYATDIPKKLNLFKDNLNCYYGLRTSKGDTILKPQYERIESFVDYFWLVYTGETFLLFMPDGSPIKSSFKKMTDIRLLERYASFKKPVKREELPDDVSIEESGSPQMFFYEIEDGRKGIIDEKGEDILPPQYCDYIEAHFFNNTQYFQSYTEDSVVYLDDKGKRLLAGKPHAFYSAFKDDYCFFSEAKPRDIVFDNGKNSFEYIDINVTSKRHTDNTNILFGLCKLDGSVLLKPQFCSIHSITESPLFVTSTKIRDLENPSDEDKKKRNVEENVLIHHGIYNAATQKWVLSPKHFVVHNLPFSVEKKYRYLLIEDTLQKKYGLMDLEGRLILPFECDTIIFRTDINLAWFKIDGLYQIFKVEGGKAVIDKAQYQFLHIFYYNYDRISGDSDYFYFLAKNKGKWGVIDGAGYVIKPFEFDYASILTIPTTSEGFYNEIVLVKNDKAYYFDFESLPNETNYNFYASTNYYGMRVPQTDKLAQYLLVDNSGKFLIVNDTGKVIIPPHYNIIQNRSNDYILFENELKKCKILFLATGNTLDFPFDFDLLRVNENEPFIKVYDVKNQLQGFVSKAGNTIIPCAYHRVEMSDPKDSIFFLQKEPTVADISQTWMMYDEHGKRLNDVYFNEPIKFLKGIGIGHEGAYANLYHKNGNVLRPFGKNTEGPFTINQEIKFRTIQPVSGSDNYVFFYQHGLNPMMMLTNSEGEIIVDGGRYEAITPFCSKYALILKDKKIGLINIKGEEIVAPQNMRQATPFLDSMKCHDDFSLEQYDKQWHYKGQYSFLGFPFSCKTKKDDNFTKQQWYALKNILTEKYASILFTKDYFDKSPYQNTAHVKIEDIALTDSFMSYRYNHILDGRDYYGFSNYYLHNGSWEDLEIHDLFNFSSPKRQAFNLLLTQKIKALKDAFINCSDPSNFLGQVENSFMTTKNGIDFYFNSTKSSKYYEIVSLSWVELSPFLKIKIKN